MSLLLTLNRYLPNGKIFQQGSKCFVNLTSYRSSHRRCSVRKGVIRNFVKFTGKHLCQSLFFNKVEGLRPALLKKRLSHRCSCEFCEITKKTFLTEHLWMTASIVISRKTFFLKNRNACTKR